RDFEAGQLRVARAGAMVDLARLSIRADCFEAERIAREGGVPTIEDKLRYKRNVAYAMELCTDAVDDLHALAGANGIYDRYPMERLFRDQHALAAHIGFSWDAQGAPWGLVVLGGDYANPVMEPRRSAGEHQRVARPHDDPRSRAFDTVRAGREQRRRRAHEEGRRIAAGRIDALLAQRSRRAHQAPAHLNDRAIARPEPFARAIDDRPLAFLNRLVLH